MNREWRTFTIRYSAFNFHFLILGSATSLIHKEEIRTETEKLKETAEGVEEVERGIANSEAEYGILNGTWSLVVLCNLRNSVNLLLPVPTGNHRGNRENRGLLFPGSHHTPRVSSRLERFTRCGDPHFGFLRLRCTNPDCTSKRERL
jgi:hypothetical protein